MTHTVINPWTVMIHFHNTPANESFNFKLIVTVAVRYEHLVQFTNKV